MNSRRFKIVHAIRNFTELDEERSEVEEHCGVKWNLVFKHAGNFGVSLHCSKEGDSDKPWSVTAHCKFRLVSLIDKKILLKKHAAARIQISFAHRFTNTSLHHSEAFPWDNTVRDHMTNGTVVVECSIAVGEIRGIALKRTMSFDEPKENLTDVELEVGDKKFHVSRVVLATHSSHFNTLFFGKFGKSKKSSHHVLNDVDADDFHTLLEIIHGNSDLTLESVEGVLSLAEKFHVEPALSVCEKYLLQADEVSRKEQLRLADAYGLEKLKRECLNSVTSYSDFKRILPGDVTILKPETAYALLQKCVSDFQQS